VLAVVPDEGLRAGGRLGGASLGWGRARV